MVNGFFLGGVANGENSYQQNQRADKQVGLQERSMDMQAEQQQRQVQQQEQAKIAKAFSENIRTVAGTIDQLKAANVPREQIRAKVAPLIKTFVGGRVASASGADPQLIAQNLEALIDAPTAGEAKAIQAKQMAAGLEGASPDARRLGGLAPPAAKADPVKIQLLRAAKVSPESPEGRAFLLSQGGQTINNNMPGADKGTDTLNSKMAESVSTIFDQNSATQKLAGTYEQLAELSNNPGVYTGAGGTAINTLKGIGKTVFGADFEGVADAEVMDKVGKLAVGEIRGMVGDQRMSDADRKNYQSIPPGLGDSAEGIQLAARIMRKTAEGMRSRQSALLGLLTENKGVFDATIMQRYSDYIANNPLLTAEDINQARDIAKKGKQQATPLAGTNLKYVPGRGVVAE